MLQTETEFFQIKIGVNGRAYSIKKGSWGKLNGVWVAHYVRDKVVDFVDYWSEKAEITARQIVIWIAISAQKYNEWKRRYGKINEHNGWIPRDSWLEDWGKKAIADYYVLHCEEGYRRLTFMMLDEDIVAVSPSSVYRVLFEAGVMRRWNRKPSKKGTGFFPAVKGT